MEITIKEPTQEGYNHTLSMKGFLPNDYIVLSVDGFLQSDGKDKFWEHEKFGKSYLAFVDVFKYYYVDIEKVEKVEKVFDTPLRCSYFMGEAMKRKIENSGVQNGQALKISMEKLDGGKTGYVVSAFNINNIKESSSNTSSGPQNEEKEDSTTNESNNEERMAKLSKAITDLKKSEMFDDEQITQMMFNNGYTKEEIKGYL